MNTIKKNPYVYMQNISVAALCVCTLFFTASGCGKSEVEYDGDSSTWFPIGAKWQYQYYGGYGEDEIEQSELTVEKDTIVGRKNCRVLRGENSKDIVCVENGRVYYYFQNKFRKIFDFNVKEGDVVNFEFKTISTNGVGHLDKTIVLPFRIVRVSTKIIDGVELKVILASHNFKSGYRYFHSYTEKVGIELIDRNLEGLFPTKPEYALPDIYQTRLLWYKDNDIEYVSNN